MKKNHTLLLICGFIGIILTSCSKTVDEPIYSPKTEIGKLMVDYCPEIYRVFKDTTYMVTVGVEHTYMQLQTLNGYIQQAHITVVDMNTPGLKVKVTLPNNSDDVTDGWKLQTLTQMSKIVDKPRSRVVAMVNGDFWDSREPIKPRGPVHVGGKILSDKFNYDPGLSEQAISFVGIRTNGEMYIGPVQEYESLKYDMKECTGGGVILVHDGKVADFKNLSNRDPRTAIGYTADGLVYFMTFDGRQKFGAAGMLYKEMAAMFETLGCKGAVNLDGGGSAQMLIRHPIANVFQIVNIPSDGKERPVTEGWTVFVDEP